MANRVSRIPRAAHRRMLAATRAAARRIGRRRMGGARVYGAKLFCVGMNKTGTTSMHRLMQGWHYDVAPQWEGERLFDEAGLRLDDRLLAWIDRHEAFQDVPFSFARIVPDLVARHPDARFVLTRRDPQDWFESLRNHHFTLLGLPPDAAPSRIAAALDACPYIAPGYLGRIMRDLFDIASDEMLYDRDHHVARLLAHDAAVRAAVPAERLLEVDLATMRDSARLAAFLGLPERAAGPLPHANRRR